MTERAEPISDQEKHFQSLKQDIISSLIKRGAAQGTSGKTLGREIITIVDDTWEGGYQALLLDVDGKWSGRHDMLPWDVDGSFDNIVGEYASLVDPQAKAIDRNFRPEEEESFEEGYQRRERELKEYVSGNKTLLADGLINTMKDRLVELKDDSLSKEPEPQITWKEYNKWHRATRDQRIEGELAHGQWPEGTPQIFIDLEKRIPSEERSNWGLQESFAKYHPRKWKFERPSITEILERPADYAEQEEQKFRDRVTSPGYKLLKEQVEEVLTTLTDRENKVMRLRFGLEDGRSRTLAQVGQEIERSRSTAGRIEKRALQKLRRPSVVQSLKDNLA